jgi:dihydroorotate dehydrogenase electron transfer subunit
MLRRAFSIAGLRRNANHTEVDVIYRVVGVATRRMEALRPGDRVSILGPLGNAFPIHPNKSQAWLISGGVGLPPMLWLAQRLHANGKQAVAFYGSQTADLLALTLEPGAQLDCDARRATLSAVEFSKIETPVVISTDDGSLGFHGRIGAATAAYHTANPAGPEDLVVYTCGPELMMRFVAEYCLERGIECHVCMEREMACGTGLCQSCVVAVRSESNRDDWRYDLCCRDGPVFEASRVIWDTGAAT